ncbi:MAG: 4-hydroxy-3-methylbut-2-enyl diphosphate reductase, partial [Candidatus Omnitrophica bacterium]|nr:4-hydroxy-3-methylbut-2-enyl diphosphate reductase [Candidatus Omnitrophota bacterium]
MKINLAKSAGFCFGVKRAVNIAMGVTRRKQPIYMLGDIVHNEDVVRILAQRGIRKIRNISRNKKGILLVAAHGISTNLFNRAKRYGYEVI